MNNNYLKQISDVVIICFTAIGFATLIFMQYTGFGEEKDFIIDYSSLILLFTAILVFELIRRVSNYFLIFKEGIIFLSKGSFGIYFVHRIWIQFIMWLNIKEYFNYQILYCVFLWFTSIGISIFLILPITKYKSISKYLFHYT